jgi:hypothetical protein
VLKPRPESRGFSASLSTPPCRSQNFLSRKGRFCRLRVHRSKVGSIDLCVFESGSRTLLDDNLRRGDPKYPKPQSSDQRSTDTCVRTYELAISLHTLLSNPGRTRPEISSKLLFRGRDGVLALDLWKEKNRLHRGELTPSFYNRSGEQMEAPLQFQEAIKKMTAAVCCIGCRHTHLGVPPAAGAAS